MNEADARAWVSQRVSRETLDRFELFAQVLRKWQRSINLVSGSTLPTIYARHIADSLQIFEEKPYESGYWVDFGSGAGLPGLICAAAARGHAPGLSFTLIESDQRKSSFLREASRIMDTPVTILTQRIEATAPQNARIISARALASLDTLCELSHRHLAPDGEMLFLKGEHHAAEQIAADRNWQMKRRIIPSKTDPRAAIYRIGALARV
ncbi:MAG: 16S rRNA (guanine(527)-N(7))-methyltransferase RsmG [Pseudomonadota bacterium]